MASVIIPENEAVTVKLPTDWASPLMRGRVAARYRAERLFKLLGLAALSLAGLFLAFLLFTIVRDGWTGFKHTEVRISVNYDPALLGVDPAAATGPGGLEAIRRGDYIGLMQRAGAQLGPAANVVSDGAWLDLRRWSRQTRRCWGRRRRCGCRCGAASTCWPRASST